MKSGFKFSDESRLKMSESAKKRSPSFLGKHHSPETKLKIREKLLGNKLSLETRRKMSEIGKKRVTESWQPKGYKHSQETKDKIRKSNTGKIRTEETKRRLSELKLKLIAEGKGLPPSRKGAKESIEQRRNKALLNKGKKCIWWKGGITPINKKIRTSLEYKIWRTAVFERDDFTCIWCGEKGGKLNADHIKPFAQYPELRFAIDNGRTLCIDCHKKTETYGNKNIWK